MTTPLSIALVSPHAWPAYDDLTWRIDAEAHALARRGHRVTVLAPARGSELLAESRTLLAAVRDGDETAALAAAGQVRVVPLGRALAAGRRRLGGPLDLSAALQDVLSRVAFDVVHVYEPLAPTPALAALRAARGVTAATFYRPEQVAGVAFVRPLVERAIGRLDVVTAASVTVRRAVAEMFDREATVIADGVDTTRFSPQAPGDGPPGVVILSRRADRAGVRFGLGVLKAVDPALIGQITVLGTSDAHWRTAAAIPKLMRGRVNAVADWGADTRHETFRAGGILLVATPEDLTGSAAIEAMACGMVVIVPRCAEADDLVGDSGGLLLTPFSRDAWATAITELAADPDRRAALAAAAVERAQARSVDHAAQVLEGLYLAAANREHGQRVGEDVIVADLRIHLGQTLAPRQLIDLCATRAIGAIAVVGDRTIEPGLETAALAGPGLTVIVGQQIHTSDGELVGLFLTDAIADGRSAADTAADVHSQGGVVMVPHPVWGEPPTPQILAQLRPELDCFEMVVGGASTMRGAITVENARLAQRFGSAITAGSGASSPEDIGSAHLRMRPFESASDFLVALEDADPVQRRRGVRPRTQRERRRPEEPSN